MRWWSWVLVVAGFCARLSVAAETPSLPPTSILIDAATGETLREQDADAGRAPGALSDLMLLLLSVEEAGLGALALDAPVAVSNSAVTAGGAGLPARGARARSGNRGLLRRGAT